MKFSLISLAVLAASQYGSAFVPGTPSRAFAKMALKSTTAEPVTTNADTTSESESDEAADPSLRGLVAAVVGGLKKDLAVAVLGDIAKEMSFVEIYKAVIFAIGTPMEAFEGIETKEWDTTKRGAGVLNDFTVEKVFNDFVPTYAPKVFASLLGKSKDAEMTVARKAVSDTNGFEQTVPGADKYNFFGKEDDHKKQLPLLLKTNPFWATALTETASGFEIKSYDPSGAAPTTLFQEIVGTLAGEGRRVNIQFDSKLERITGFQAYDLGGNDISHTGDKGYWASAAMYNIFFHASCVHAVIHVLHYLMTAAFMEAAPKRSDLKDLAESYGKNIRNKYFQVGLLLITDPHPEITIPGGPVFAPADASLITGVNGFGSSQAVRPILENLLNTWGEATSAEEVFTGLMNISPDKMEEAGILSEFSQHYALIKPYAKQMSEALEAADSEEFKKTESQMAKNLKDCGNFKSNINSIRSWLEIMSVTGLIHGATLSYSRLVTDPHMMRWRNIRGTTWDAADINIINAILGTVVGTEEGRHVMGSEFTGTNYNEGVQEVLNKFDKKSEKLKYAYKKELLQDRGTFNDYGFILTDYGPDNFDGKQLTIATYI